MKKEDFLNKWIDALPLNSKDSDRKEMEYDLNQLLKNQTKESKLIADTIFKEVCKEIMVEFDATNFDKDFPKLKRAIVVSMARYAHQYSQQNQNKDVSDEEIFDAFDEKLEDDEYLGIDWM